MRCVLEYAGVGTYVNPNNLSENARKEQNSRSAVMCYFCLIPLNESTYNDEEDPEPSDDDLDLLEVVECPKVIKVEPR